MQVLSRLLSREATERDVDFALNRSSAGFQMSVFVVCMGNLCFDGPVCISREVAEEAAIKLILEAIASAGALAATRVDVQPLQHATSSPLQHAMPVQRPALPAPPQDSWDVEETEQFAEAPWKKVKIERPQPEAAAMQQPQLAMVVTPALIGKSAAPPPPPPPGAAPPPPPQMEAMPPPPPPPCRTANDV